MIQFLRSLVSSTVLPIFSNRCAYLNAAGLVFILNFTACHGTNPVDSDKSKSTIVNAIDLPAPAVITDAEKTKLHDTCELWYDTVLKHRSFNGGMLVAKAGNIVFEQYSGTNPLGSKDSINDQTPFHIASVSKTFTAMAVLKLVETGKLHLEDEVSKYFPTFNYPGISIQSLLSHRSGLPNYLYFMEDLGWNDTVNIKNQDVFDYLVNRKDEIKNIATPNARFNYCNTNYALLALLIEKISGMSYPQYIQQTFFTPLNMKNSFVFTPAESKRASPNYDWRGQVIANNYLDYVYGDKNIYTTPRDLLIWHRALSSNLLFKSETLQAAYQPYSNERAGIKNYGLGWRMNIYPNGKKVIFHNG
ncbi:MAG TPA: serine hydrolase domain-containing protein, partial [Ferruginibacter sp.]|nr:serine hydrolase domain-containing protein [Ferruginibacter sp.]